MGMTYNYDNGRITRDFVFKKVEGSCHQDPNKTMLIGVMCRTCPFYDGEYKWWGRLGKGGYFIDLDSHKHLVKCKYHKEDDPGLDDVIHDMYDKFREEAITHFYD